MTELATPPAEQAQEIKRISHWIGGRTVEGTSGRSGPVYNPALGKQTGAVDFLGGREVDGARLDAARRVVDRPAPPGFPRDDAAADPVADPLDVLLPLDGWRS